MRTIGQELRALVRPSAPERERAFARADLAPLPLRLMLGAGLLYHGIPKVFTAQGHERFAGMLTDVGVPLPHAAAWGVGAFEVIGGGLLILGVFVTAVSVLGVAEMLVALFAIHLPHGFNFMNVTGMSADGPQFGMPGYEVNLLYIAGFLALAITGAGALALWPERWRPSARASPRGSWARR